jgi:hypothetical protein
MTHNNNVCSYCGFYICVCFDCIAIEANRLSTLVDDFIKSSKKTQAMRAPLHEDERAKARAQFKEHTQRFKPHSRGRRR